MSVQIIITTGRENFNPTGGATGGTDKSDLSVPLSWYNDPDIGDPRICQRSGQPERDWIWVKVERKMRRKESDSQVF